MKKRLLSLLAALSLLCTLVIPAYAAETPDGVSVQLDGEAIVFPDADPQSHSGRIFLPCRAVFEAMGAEVAINDSVITATRGDVTVIFTIGELEATVTRGEETSTLTMDVAPYVDETTWRTYVPIRFAAAALGCSVGWDQETRTAVIVDVEQLMDETLAGKEFSILEQFIAYSQKYNVGNWSMESTCSGDVQLMGLQAMTLFGTMQGLTSGTSTAEMSMTLDIDMTALAEMQAAASGLTLEEMGLTEADLKQNIPFAIKMDLETGVMYMQFGGSFNGQLGLPEGAWLSMDLNDILSMQGMDMLDMDVLMNELSVEGIFLILKESLAAYPLDGKSVGGYDELSSLISQVAALLSDESFQETEAGYTMALSPPVEGAQMAFELLLTTDEADEINGYAIELSASLPLDEAIQDALTQQGLPADSISMEIFSTVDANDVSTSTVSMSLGSVFGLDMVVDAVYAATDEQPDVALPEDAVVVDYLELITSQLQPSV